MAVKELFCFYPFNVKWNHGVALLSALCKQQGIKTEMFMLDYLPAFERRLKEWTEKEICFSIVTQKDWKLSLPFMEMAHRAGKKVLVGGTFMGLKPNVPEFIAHVCYGEAENLPTYFLEGNTSIFDSKLAWTDLNNLPLPDYSLFEKVPFDRRIPELAGIYYLPYVSSRGCPAPCTFCQVRFQPPFRVRTKVKEDLSEIIGRYHPELIYMPDAILPYFVPAWKASWENLRVPFVGYIRADIKPDDLEWLIDRGLKGCGFGIESGDERFRNESLKKELTDEQLWRTVDTLKRHGIWNYTFFMTGLPGESFIHKTKTAQMAEKFEKHTFVWQYEELSQWASG
jgi:radical SAM superfamily enzyme YgiQ (UPF0313 family)